MTTDFSPAMLKSFLLLRVSHLVAVSFPSAARSAELAELRKASGLSREDFDLALAGRLKSAEKRRRIWVALWLDPAAVGVTLTDGGQEPSP